MYSRFLLVYVFYTYTVLCMERYYGFNITGKSNFYVYE